MTALGTWQNVLVQNQMQLVGGRGVFTIIVSYSYLVAEIEIISVNTLNQPQPTKLNILVCGYEIMRAFEVL